MITGDNPLTAVHVAREVEIVDREALILDMAENARNEQGWLLLTHICEIELLMMFYLKRPCLAYGRRA